VNIVVCVKQVPDTTAKKELGPDFVLIRQGVDSVINPFDEYAIEEALRLKESQGGDVTIVTMGPPTAEDSIRKALAMGADRGVLVSDPALRGTDWLGTARVLARAIGTTEADLVVTGTESTEARDGMMSGALAELLDLPLLSYVMQLEVDESNVRVRRQIAGGYQVAEAQLPAVVSVVKGANEPRYPSLKGIMGAKRKEIQNLSLADLGVDPSDVGLQGAATQVLGATARPERVAGEVMRPDSPEDAAIAIADFLQAGKFI